MLSKRSKEETTNLPRTGGEPSQLRLLVISMIILVLQAITLAIVLIFRQFICLFLKLKYGKRFGGFMSPGDVIWMGDDDSEHITNTVVLMDSKMKSEQFNLSFKKDIIENPMVHNHPLTDLKLCSSCHSFMGYVFYLKDNNNKLDCITMLDCGDSNKDFMEKSDLTDVLSECATRPLPRNNSVLWEVVTIKQPLKVENAENGVHTNVVIFRFHHAMGDGMSIVNFLLRNLTDDQQKIHDHLDKLTKRAFNRNKAHQKSAISTSLKNNYLRLLQLVMMGPYILKRGMLRFKNNQNILHGTRLSRDKYVVYSTERDGERLLDAMKQMKNEVPGGMLSAVALIAISRALRRFYNMNSKEVPSSVPVSMPIPMTVPKIEEKIITKNSLSAALLSLPLLSSKTTVRNQLAAVVEEIRGAISQPDVVVTIIAILYCYRSFRIVENHYQETHRS
ncbi:unnamed protein product [Acanthoscelides obtectus]|uniref:O-acyltransferase WSD1 C-terminal domain-containing protein n=1 Tax=Acanthoscelides obtectus TaxID=200917 RepID=A0A9P0K6P4_ACAOB|nr:unnamed protein product [Acanthoscelides obtectus]CAK1631104.1 hypothetical protein AOBTE_LOCUS6759 [Acanthoscelides obtectus]